MHGGLLTMLWLVKTALTMAEIQAQTDVDMARGEGTGKLVDRASTWLLGRV
jgi:hypothetical protein